MFAIACANGPSSSFVRTTPTAADKQKETQQQRVMGGCCCCYCGCLLNCCRWVWVGCERGRCLVAGRTSFFLTNCQRFCFWQIKSVHEKLVCSSTYHSTLALYICIFWAVQHNFVITKATTHIRMCALSKKRDKRVESKMSLL